MEDGRSQWASRAAVNGNGCVVGLAGPPGTGNRIVREISSRAAVDALFTNGQFTVCMWATSVLVIALLQRGTADDLAESDTAIGRLDAAPLDDLIVRDICVLRLRALLAQARGDETYRGLRDRYRDMANDFGFEGHMSWAAAMP
jgi:adenylate cyclase